jgi:hypothetical protein
MLLGELDLTSTAQEDTTEPNNEICASRGDPSMNHRIQVVISQPSGRQETGASPRPSPPEPMQTYPLAVSFLLLSPRASSFSHSSWVPSLPLFFWSPALRHPYLIPTPAAGECQGRNGPAPYRRGWGKTEFDSTPESNLSCSKLRRSIMRSVTPVAYLCRQQVWAKVFVPWRSGCRSFDSVGSCATLENPP